MGLESDPMVAANFSRKLDSWYSLTGKYFFEKINFDDDINYNSDVLTNFSLNDIIFKRQFKFDTS